MKNCLFSFLKFLPTYLFIAQNGQKGLEFEPVSLLSLEYLAISRSRNHFIKMGKRAILQIRSSFYVLQIANIYVNLGYHLHTNFSRGLFYPCQNTAFFPIFCLLIFEHQVIKSELRQVKRQMSTFCNQQQQAYVKMIPKKI